MSEHSPVNRIDPDSTRQWPPAHVMDWPVTKLSRRYRVQLGKMLDAARQTADHQTPYLRNRDVQWDSISTDDLPTMDVMPAELDRYTVADGDLLVCEGGDVGRAAIWTGQSRKVAYQKALHRLRPLNQTRESVKFMYYQLVAAKASGQFESDDAKATIAHLPAEDFREMRFVFPPLEHQAAVAAFLDLHTARIDTLIEKKKQLIELLEEKRQAVISQAVTKSIEPGSASVQLKHIVDVLPGFAFKSEDFRSENESGVRLLRGINVGVGKVVWRSVARIDEEKSMPAYKLKLSDVVLGMDRPWIAAGTRVARVDELSEGALLVQRVARLRCGRRADSRFVERCLASQRFQDQLETSVTGVSVPHISPEQIKSFEVLDMPLADQRVAMDLLDVQLVRIELLEKHAHDAIDLLNERRTALISAAVTGQIDITTYAPSGTTATPPA